MVSLLYLFVSEAGILIFVCVYIRGIKFIGHEDLKITPPFLFSQLRTASESNLTTRIDSNCEIPEDS